jgi:spermidine synthase
MDEYRYHEALVHVGLHAMPSRKKILVLGGGDGLAVREILKYPDVESVTLVDLDPGMTVLFRDSPLLASLNEHAFSNPKVTVINEDAFVWLRNTKERFDFAVVDFPDPTNFSIGKLYTTTFYKTLLDALAPKGAAVVQSTSPFMARQSFWSVDATLRASGFETAPYHVYVPSFGEWGFVLASRSVYEAKGVFQGGLKFINDEVLPSLFYFPADMSRIDADINRLNNQSLVHYYEKEWARYGL